MGFKGRVSIKAVAEVKTYSLLFSAAVFAVTYSEVYAPPPLPPFKAYDAVTAYDEVRAYDDDILAVDAELLKAATDALIVWSVVVREELKADIADVEEPLILVTIKFLAVEADELNAVDDPVTCNANKSLAVDDDELVTHT